MKGYKGLFFLLGCLLVFYLPIAARASEDSQAGTGDVEGGDTQGEQEEPIVPAVTAEVGTSTERVEASDETAVAPAADAASNVVEGVEHGEDPTARRPLPGLSSFVQVLNTAANLDPTLFALMMLIPLVWEEIDLTRRRAQLMNVTRTSLRGSRLGDEGADSGDSSKPADGSSE